MWVVADSSEGYVGQALADPDDGEEGDRPLEPQNDDGVAPLRWSGKMIKIPIFYTLGTYLNLGPA